MNKKKILAIEDEDDIRELLRYNIEKHGYEFYGAASGESGWNKIKDIKPDLVLLDLMLPGIDGLEVCQRIKTELGSEAMPVIMLTARGEEGDIVKGLEMGADDYMTKPFSVKVLFARIAKIFRTLPSNSEGSLDSTQTSPSNQDLDKDVFESNGIRMDIARHEVKVAELAIQLTSSEFKALSVFLQSQGRVFTRNQIMEKVHGEGYVVSERAIDVMIVGLRKKLGEVGACIETIRGIGYRLMDS